MHLTEEKKPMQVRDYRKCVSEPGSCTLDGCPIINKVHLRMSLENIVKDVPLISDDSWTYSDLMVSIHDVSFPFMTFSTSRVFTLY